MEIFQIRNRQEEDGNGGEDDEEEYDTRLTS